MDDVDRGREPADGADDFEDALATLERVVSYPPEKWYLVAKNLKCHQDLVALTLIDEARENWRDDPVRARHAAAAAVAAVEERAAESAEAATVCALAHAIEGNVARMQARFEEAENSFKRAWAWYGRGQPPLEVWAEIALYDACLLRARRQLRPAIKLFHKAALAAALVGANEIAFRCLLLIAFALAEAGRLDLSIHFLEDLIPLLAGAKLDELYATALQNLAVSYAQQGEGAKARSLLPEIRERVRALGSWNDLLRLDWLDGLTCLAEGNSISAEGYFLKVQQETLAADLSFDAALVSLDLAALYLDEGQTDKAAGMAAELVPVFRNLGIERETVAAGLVLLHSLEKKCATAQAVRAFADRLRLAKLV